MTQDLENMIGDGVQNALGDPDASPVEKQSDWLEDFIKNALDDPGATPVEEQSD